MRDRFRRPNINREYAIQISAIGATVKAMAAGLFKRRGDASKNYFDRVDVGPTPGPLANAHDLRLSLRPTLSPKRLDIFSVHALDSLFFLFHDPLQPQVLQVHIGNTYAIQVLPRKLSIEATGGSEAS